MLDQDGPAAPPRTNGELVFESPWESRLFGLTMSLHEAGLFEWEEFRSMLLEANGIWDAERHPEEGWSYYEHWAAAFEKLLAKKNFCASAELDGRVAAFSSRPHGHDH